MMSAIRGQKLVPVTERQNVNSPSLKVRERARVWATGYRSARVGERVRQVGLKVGVRVWVGRENSPSQP